MHVSWMTSKYILFFKEKVADAAFKKRIENYKEHAAQIMDKQNKQLHKLLALRDVASSLWKASQKV